MTLHFIKIRFIVFSAVMLSAFWSCQPKSITDAPAYFKYLADKSHGLAKEKTIAGITFKVKYLPADYMAYNVVKETSGLSQTKKDSIKKTYDNSITFILNIGPAENESFDIMKLGINNYAEFAGRVEQMAFEAQDWMSIRSNGMEVKPVIARLENINSLEKSRTFIVVFNSEKNTEKDLRNTDMCFTYNDELFNTGTNKFIFKASDIKALPEFKF